MKKFILLCAVAVMALGFNSCKEETTIQEGYAFGISKFESSNALSDMAKVQKYLQDNGCPITPQIFEGKDKKETDAKCKETFEGYVAKLSKTALDGLGLSSGMSFTYSASRLKEPTNPNSETLVIASFEYTAPTVQ